MTNIIANIIGNVAPTIAKALDGPLTGSAVSFICNALGLPTDTSEAAIAQTIQNNPQALVELKKAELAFQQHLSDNQIELYKSTLADKDSARNMRTQLRDRFPDFLAFLIVMGFFSVIYLVWVKDMVPPDTKDLANVLFGIAGAKFSSVVDFYFGSSRE
jgi:hypothetical protein